MVAINTLHDLVRRPRVRLGVSFLAWRHRAAAGVFSRGGRTGPTKRFLSTAEPLFLIERGVATVLVADADGRVWKCPLNYLAA